MMTEMKTADDTRIARQKTDTPEDRRITKLIFDLLKTPWSEEMAKSIQERMVDFFDFAFANIETPEKVRLFFERTLEESAQISKAHIASGEEYLTGIKDKKGVIVVVNHFGFYKATMVPNKNGKYPVALDTISPFPVRLIATKCLSDKLNVNLFETALELPTGLLEIQEVCNGITIPNEGTGRTQILIKKVEKTLDKNPRAIVVMYPEGGTSGKSNMGSPYDLLDDFQSGTFFVATALDLPILPACIYLNTDKGLEVHILEPLSVNDLDEERIKKVAQETKGRMQNKLDELSKPKQF